MEGKFLLWDEILFVYYTSIEKLYCLKWDGVYFNRRNLIY